MKSMNEIQNEMLKDCRFDGGYPKPMHVGMGILRVAKSKEEEEQINKETFWIHVIGFGSAIILMPILIYFVFL